MNGEERIGVRRSEIYYSQIFSEKMSNRIACDKVRAAQETSWLRRESRYIRKENVDDARHIPERDRIVRTERKKMNIGHFYMGAKLPFQDTMLRCNPNPKEEIRWKGQERVFSVEYFGKERGEMKNFRVHETMQKAGSNERRNIYFQ